MNGGKSFVFKELVKYEFNVQLGLYCYFGIFLYDF